MFRLLLITAPTALPNEPRLLTELLAQGVPRLHLRKPGWPAGQVAALIEALPPQFRARLVLHGHPELVRSYQLDGLHLTTAGRLATARRPALLPGQTLSTSFHSLAEISRHRRRYDYVFLSPIFDSISKVGYARAFELTEVRAFLQKLAGRAGYRPQVLALGGVDSQNISLVQEAGFAGAAVLGCVWGSADPVRAWQQLAGYASAASQSFHTGS
ncbi:thiamine phosphate synthase [Hymenobacter arcticus]